MNSQKIIQGKNRINRYIDTISEATNNRRAKMRRIMRAFIICIAA